MDASWGFDLTHYIFVTLGSLSLALTGKHRQCVASWEWKAVRVWGIAKMKRNSEA